jgi:hypothetical protein
MGDVIYGYTPEVVETLRVAGPVVRGIVLDNGIVLEGQSLGAAADERLGSASLALGNVSDSPLTEFERWLMERWLRQIRSEGFRKTADWEYLRAEWERTG